MIDQSEQSLEQCGVEPQYLVYMPEIGRKGTNHEWIAWWSCDQRFSVPEKRTLEEVGDVDQGGYIAPGSNTSTNSIFTGGSASTSDIAIFALVAILIVALVITSVRYINLKNKPTGKHSVSPVGEDTVTTVIDS